MDYILLFQLSYELWFVDKARENCLSNEKLHLTSNQDQSQQVDALYAGTPDASYRCGKAYCFVSCGQDRSISAWQEAHPSVCLSSKLPVIRPLARIGALCLPVDRGFRIERAVFISH